MERKGFWVDIEDNCGSDTWIVRIGWGLRGFYRENKVLGLLWARVNLGDQIQICKAGESKGSLCRAWDLSSSILS